MSPSKENSPCITRGCSQHFSSIYQILRILIWTSQSLPSKEVLDLPKLFLIWGFGLKKSRIDLLHIFWNIKKRTSRVFNSTFKNVLPSPHPLTCTHNYSCSMLSQKPPQIHSVSFFCSNFCLFHYCILIAYHLARHRIDNL